jgi:hypothetical protein
MIATPQDPLTNREYLRSAMGPAYPKGIGRGNVLRVKEYYPLTQAGEGGILPFETVFILLVCAKTP